MSEIDAMAARYAAAAYAKNENDFLALYDENVVVFDMWEQWSYKGRDAWAEAVRSWFGSLGSTERVGIKFSGVACQSDHDWASWCATVRYAGLGPDDAELRFMQNRMSWTLKRKDGVWKIIQEHSSAPADFESLKVRLREEKT